MEPELVQDGAAYDVDLDEPVMYTTEHCGNTTYATTPTQGSINAAPGTEVEEDVVLHIFTHAKSAKLYGKGCDLRAGIAAFMVVPTNKSGALVKTSEWSGPVIHHTLLSTLSPTLPYTKICALVMAAEHFETASVSAIFLYSDQDTTKMLKSCDSYAAGEFGETLEHEGLWLRLTASTLKRKINNGGKEYEFCLYNDKGPASVYAPSAKQQMDRQLTRVIDQLRSQIPRECHPALRVPSVAPS